MAKYYKGSNILVLESGAHSETSPNYFLLFKVDLTFGEILTVYGKTHNKYLYSYSSCAKDLISANALVLFKRCRAKLLEETCNYPGI